MRQYPIFVWVQCHRHLTKNDDKPPDHRRGIFFVLFYDQRFMSGFHIIPNGIPTAPTPKVPITEPNVSAAIKRDPCCETNFDGGGGADRQGPRLEHRA